MKTSLLTVRSLKTLPVRFAYRDVNPEFVALVDRRHPAG